MREQHPVEDAKPDDFVSSYEIVDDTPPPPTLDERKAALVSEATQLAVSAMAKIMPPLKASQWSYEVADAIAVDEKERNPEQCRALLDNEARQKRIQAVYRHLAKLHSDIDDLNAGTVDAWKPLPFPG